MRLGLLVIVNVQSRKFFKPQTFDRIHIPPRLDGVDKFTELRAVVAKVVYADGIIAERRINPVKRGADNGGGKVPYMKGLGDIDRRIVYADGLAVTFVGIAVLIAHRENLLDHATYDVSPV